MPADGRWDLRVTGRLKGSLGLFTVIVLFTRTYSWNDSVTNEVLHTVSDEGSILHPVTGRKANRIGQILRRNCVLKHVK